MPSLVQGDGDGGAGASSITRLANICWVLSQAGTSLRALPWTSHFLMTSQWKGVIFFLCPLYREENCGAKALGSLPHGHAASQHWLQNLHFLGFFYFYVHLSLQYFWIVHIDGVQGDSSTHIEIVPWSNQGNEYFHVPVSLSFLCCRNLRTLLVIHKIQNKLV